MPRLWSDTIDAHRQEVRDAILQTAAALVAEHGLRGVTMSQLATETGIGRATLYKYFPDVESILLAWHDRQVSSHLDRLRDAAEREGNPARRLETVLTAYALISHDTHRHHGDVAAFLHRGDRIVDAQQQLRRMIRDVIAAGAEAGAVREDVAPDELARYCLDALAGAKMLPSKAAVRRVVTLTLDALRPPP